MARLKSLPATHTATTKLGIQVGDASWLVDLTDVSEVLPVPGMVDVPLTRRWFKGVANIRGNLFSVVDLPGFLGDEPVQPAVSSRLLLIHPRHIVNSALLVNRMLGLRNVQSMEEVAPADPAVPWCGPTRRDADGRDWRELRIAELVQQAPFLQVGTI
ncbi:chemotaxis protein CheW [Chitinimonas koreensis]|uniref:chemotaxis protein CheW n=1 Tax=Chitinimonas koreensis TaxID=356302 RepID=UPI000409C6CD|nr:chemotaxis protein CheW [Chitinimonas koreensis]QNM96491.1 chemotaxis protein CheW [Chitinimonas koreensis]